MHMTKKIAVLVGSLRKESLTRKYAQAIAAVLPPSLQCEFVELGDLPLYNQDLDDAGTPPAAWTAFRDALRSADAVLFVTPEYNRSIPGALKNAIDVGSRPWGHSIWDRKPSAVVSQSPGAIGGFGANHHVRQTMVALNSPVMAGPEMYIGGSAGFLAEDGTVNNEQTRTLLTTFGAAFEQWVEANARQG
nr:NAD(P)H-dependent oxidoreductase [Pseudoduganella plicata]